MADEADKGNEAAELFLREAMSHIRNTAIPTGVGMCLNCGAALRHDGRWCDTECRADHERYTRGH